MKKIGLLIPCTNLTVEYELQYLYNTRYFNINDFVFYVSKLQYKTNYKDDEIQFLKDIANDEESKIKELEYLNVEYIASFCTSASFISKKMLNNPADAILKIAKQKNIRKCFLITPYNEVVGKQLERLLNEKNIEVIYNVNLDLVHTKDYFDFGLNKLEKFIMNDYKKEYGDIIISCTNIPTIHFINKLQNRLNCKIISSNSCMFEQIHEL